jgi:hypothetical protein
MREANAVIFDRLKEQVVEHGFWGQAAKQDAVRFIKTTDDEKAVLKKAKVEACEQCLPGRSVAVISAATRRFVVLPEVCDEAVPLLDGMTSRADLNAGLMTVVLSLDVYGPRPGKENAAEIADELFARDGAYEVAEVARFFAPVHAWEMDPEKARDPVVDAYRCYAAFHLQRPPLPYPPCVKGALRALLESQCGTLAPEALFRAITSVHWHHAFLELYRCVEQYFVAPYICDLADALGHARKFVSERMATHIPWKPIEEAALTKLLEAFPEARRQALLDLISLANPGASAAPTAENAAKAIYRMRNSIAHHRGSRDLRRALDWPAIVEHMCALVDDVTQRYGTAL